jgi:hypothetical protein
MELDELLLLVIAEVVWRTPPAKCRVEGKLDKGKRAKD